MPAVPTLKLLALPTSPFAARLLIQAREKGLDLSVEFPRGETGPAGHAALNPFARTPILVAGPDVLIESAAIAEYLEDLHPLPGLRGSNPMANARMRAFIRAVDLYLFPLMFRLRSLSPGESEDAGIWTELSSTLSQLEQLCGNQGYACDSHLTLADCALVPACFFLGLFHKRHGKPAFLPQHRILDTWWTTVNRHKSVQQVLSDLALALQTKR